MFINANSLKVKKSTDPDTSYINLGNYITEARYSYNKVWSGDDSGRSLSGKMSGTLIGIFPKIIVSLKRLTKTELETITPILDAPRQTLQYYDPTKQQVETMETYTGDYEVINKHIINGNGKNDNFEVSFIAIDKRS